MDAAALIVQWVGGAAGAKAAAMVWRFSPLGVLATALTGAIGGLLGGQIIGEALGTFRSAAAGWNAGIIVSDLVASGIGGLALGAFVSIVQGRVAGPR